MSGLDTPAGIRTCKASCSSCIRVDFSTISLTCRCRLCQDASPACKCAGVATDNNSASKNECILASRGPGGNAACCGIGTITSD